MKNRVCCLYRVSTAKQVDHTEENKADIPMQRKACREFAEHMGWEIVREEQEAGVSGFKVSAADRDKLQTIKQAAEKGKFDILLVFMFDRLGRKSDETPFVVEWFSKHGVKVWSVQEGEQRFDSHTDHLTNYIRFWQADGESKKTSMRTKTALGQMVKEGRFRGGIAPFGYKLVGSGILNKRKHEVKKLVIDDDEASVVRLIFDMCANSGFGRCKIANILNNKGIKTRKGANWHEATIGHILHNITYIGVLRSGDSKSEMFEELQIIELDIFEKARNLMQERINEFNEKRYVPRNVSGQSLLSGNVFCGHCGGRLTLTTSGTKRTNASGDDVFSRRVRYVCYNKTRHRQECNGQTGYTMSILDGIVTEILRKIFDKMRAINKSDILLKIEQSSIVEIQKQIKLATKAYNKASVEYERLKAEVVKAVSGNSSFSVEILSELVETAKVNMLSEQQKMQSLQTQLDGINTKVQSVKYDYTQVLHWAEIFDSSSNEIKKMIANRLIKRVTVNRDYKLNIELNVTLKQFELGIDVDEVVMQNRKGVAKKSKPE